MANPRPEERNPAPMTHGSLPYLPRSCCKLSVDRTLGAVVLNCANADALADFYAEFLERDKNVQNTALDRWVVVNDPAWKNTPLVFQEIAEYQPPVWSAEAGRQQQMTHLDFYVGAPEELEKKSRHAEHCGAKLAGEQFSSDWRVFLDPAGHPFCLIPIPEEMMKLIEENS